ncbi:MHYT domain-containing protein [Streptomyces sp. NPDC005899]|uniref:MHYT domain-containing protein n=1 Tax=Streptomyces sp. NPDC005899 TaxID=3155716 RepID=UPI00340C578C
MQGTVDGFGYGFVTPVVAFLLAWLGAALGLRCTTRSLHARRSRRAGWLALAATSIGSGIWTMHFVAMLGFTVEEAAVTYDRPLTFASLAVAVVMVGVGIFLVGYRGATPMALVTGGTITGLGVASMHYLGMAGMQFDGQFAYDTLTVSLSVVIAVVASTASLWAAVSIRGLLPSLGAGVVMGVAVSGMHYTGMAALQVHLHPGAATGTTGDTPTSLLLPMMIGPGCFLLLAGVVLVFDPLVVTDGPDGPEGRARPSGRGLPAGGQVTAIPVQRRHTSSAGTARREVRQPRDR